MHPILLRVSQVSEILTALPADADTWLSATEQTRLHRLQVQSRRDQYLGGHWLARCLLAEQRGGQPEDWPLAERPGLPPAVVDHESRAQLSLSHSGDWIAVAISTSAIGIDIEQRQPARDALLRLQHLLLADDELTDTLSVDALLQRWVVKEAWIKRDHGSALPEHLAAVKLRKATAATGNVRLFTTDALHLGICAHTAQPWDAAMAGDASHWQCGRSSA